MFIRLFILFALIPIIELYLLIKVGGMIGALNTVIIILFTATAGAYLAKTQGFAVLKKINEAVSEGRPPAAELMDGLFVLIGGFMLLTPGFITDFLGLSMLVPPVRSIYKKIAGNIIKQKIDTGKWNIRFFG